MNTTPNATIQFNSKTITAPTRRAYTHAVVWTDGEYTSVINWCGSIALAEKAARKASQPEAPRGVRIMGCSKALYIQPQAGRYYVINVATNDTILYATV
jgi:hypothetical protein